MSLTIEEKEKLMKSLAEKHPAIATINKMINDYFPYGLKGILQIEEDIEELKSFEGTDEEFTLLMRKKRDEFRKRNGIEDIAISDDEREKFENIAKLVKIITNEEG